MKGDRLLVCRLTLSRILICPLLFVKKRKEGDCGQNEHMDEIGWIRYSLCLVVGCQPPDKSEVEEKTYSGFFCIFRGFNVAPPGLNGVVVSYFPEVDTSGYYIFSPLGLWNLFDFVRDN